MATLKQRLHRKNSSGTYDTIHLESTSDLILRPSGRTVEQDLVDYLPQVQNHDNVPQTLNWVRGNTKAFVNQKSILLSGDAVPDLKDSTNTDFNTFTTTGICGVTCTAGTNQTTLHTPFGEETAGYNTVTYYVVETISYFGGYRLGQIAISCFEHNPGMWYRQKHDTTWGSWYHIDKHTHEISQINNLQNEINSLKTSVSNGKSAVASAITDKGVSTSATATFDTMARNIRNIASAPKLLFTTQIVSYNTQITLPQAVSYVVIDIISSDPQYNTTTTLRVSSGNVVIYSATETGMTGTGKVELTANLQSSTILYVWYQYSGSGPNVDPASVICNGYSQ